MTQTNRDIIERRLEALTPNGKYQEESLNQMKQRYFVDKAADLEFIPTAKVIGYDFQYEMELGEKRLKRIENIESAVVKLERHAYAPEMNCLHFKNGKTFRVNRLTELDESIMFAAISLSEKQIQDFISS